MTKVDPNEFKELFQYVQNRSQSNQDVEIDLEKDRITLRAYRTENGCGQSLDVIAAASCCIGEEFLLAASLEGRHPEVPTPDFDSHFNKDVRENVFLTAVFLSNFSNIRIG